MRSAWAALRRLVARLPIRWRLTLMSFGLLAVLLAALGTLLSISEEHALLTNQANALHREARLASGVLHTSSLSLAHTGQVIPAATGTIPTAAYPALDMLVARLANPSTGVAVLATNGSLLVSRATDPVATGPAAAPAVAVPANATRQALETSPSDDAYLLVRGTGGHSQLVVLLPVVNSLDGNAVAVLQINTSVAPIETTVATTRLLLALGIIAALVVAGALTFPLMSAGLRPLVSMERASRKIATGALSLRLEEPPANDEIGRLSRSFNSMVEQLEAAFTRQKRFAADVSHELRTPLTALGGEIEMLLLGADRGEAEAVRRLARGMYAEVERMRRLVEDLLTLTRLDEGRAELRMGSVELGRTFRDVVDQAEGLARSQRMQCDVEPALPAIRADADRLRQVLLNLIDNALKYSPAPGTITLSARRGGPGIVAIQVADTGVGISREALPHVFERFYRADPARARSPLHSGGAGLGLSIVKSLVEVQGGTIAIASELGRGTSVTLHFPSVPSGQTPQLAAPTGAGESRS